MASHFPSGRASGRALGRASGRAEVWRAFGGRAACVVCLAWSLGCVPVAERVTERRLEAAARDREQAPPVRLDGSFEAYVARAMQGSPTLEASFERWRAAAARVSGRRRWPRPQLSYTALVQPVETRVGPQRQRVGARVPLAWPARLRSGAEVGAALADAEAERFEAEALSLRARVAEAYWSLWLVARRARALDEEARLLDGVVELARARVVTGQGSFAMVQMAEFRRIRVRDTRAAVEASRRRGEASLRALVGLGLDEPVVVDAEVPELRALGVAPEVLRSWASSRPEVRAHGALARAGEASERSAAAQRAPDLALAVEWMETGPARMPNVPGDGDDAWVFGVTVGIPVDLRALSDERRAARADAAAHRADARAGVLAAEAELEAALADLEDARRRVRVYAEELGPAAEAAWESTSAAFVIGRASFADVLLAARERVELRFGGDEAAASFARAWARIEAAVGRAIEGEEEASDLADADLVPVEGQVAP